MGSHRARHRADQNQSEELATDLLARLADEAGSRPAPTRHTSSSHPRPTLDPFSTAPFPAHPPTTAGPDPQTAVEPDPQAAAEPDPQTAADAGSELPDEAGHIPAPRLPSGPDAPFPLEDVPDDPDDRAFRPADAPHTARGRLAGLRSRPVYAAVSATVITATAAVAATTGHSIFTSDRAASPALAAAALDLGSPGPKPAPARAGAVLAPGQATPAAPSPTSPVSGATIAADAKAYAAQARQAARTATAAPKAQPAPQATFQGAPRATSQPASKPVAPRAAPAATAGSTVAARALALAKGKLGNPYVWGAAGPSAFDCSGLVVWAYKQLGVSLPHSSSALSTMGTPVSKSALQPGDLVFFYSPVSHVGIYAGNGMVLNATQSGEPVQFTNLANLPFHNAMRVTV